MDMFTFEKRDFDHDARFTIPGPNDPAWLPGRRNWMLPYTLCIVIPTTVLVVLRVVCRIDRSGGKIGTDDILIVLAWAQSMAMSGCIVYGAMHLGWDRHMMAVAPTLWSGSADEAVQIFGGRGLTQTGMGRVVEMFNRTYKFDAILGGAEEILADLGVRQALKFMPKAML